MNISRRTLLKIMSSLPIIGVMIKPEDAVAALPPEVEAAEPSVTEIIEPKFSFGLLAFSEEELNSDRQIYVGVPQSDLRIKIMTHGHRQTTTEGDYWWIRVPVYRTLWKEGPRFTWACGQRPLYLSQAAAMVDIHGKMAIAKDKGDGLFEQGIPEAVRKEGPIFYYFRGLEMRDSPSLEVW